jgi:hypothetical protein
MNSAPLLEGNNRLDSYRPRATRTTEREGVRRLLNDHLWGGADRFYGFRISGVGVHSDLARGVESRVFDETFGNDPHVMSREYGPYEAHSTFFLLIDRDQEQVGGVIRVIGHSDVGLKTFNDIAGAPLHIPTDIAMAAHNIPDLGKCWDIATLAVPRDYRTAAKNAHVSSMLYGMLFVDARRAGIDHAVAILDARAYRHLVTVFGAPFVPMLGTPGFPYLGSACSYAVYVHFPSAAEAMDVHLSALDTRTRRLVAPFTARMAHGEGLPPLIEVW